MNWWFPSILCEEIWKVCGKCIAHIGKACKRVAAIQAGSKVIYPKYSKHWPYTEAFTIDCVCSKILNHGLNNGLFFSLFKLISCPIHWIVYVLAYSNFIFHISFIDAQNGRFCPDTKKYEFHLNCLEHSICISLP